MGCWSMNTEVLNRWLSLATNIGVFAGLVFVALEIRTNTESNDIAIRASSASNWMALNSTIVENRDVADLFEKGLAGEDLDRAEGRQFSNLVSMYLTHSLHMKNLYDNGLISEADVRGSFRAIRNYAKQGRFREEIEKMHGERNRSLILEPDGLDDWLNQNVE
jgi:hypothetical protein